MKILEELFPSEKSVISKEEEENISNLAKKVYNLIKEDPVYRDFFSMLIEGEGLMKNDVEKEYPQIDVNDFVEMGLIKFEEKFLGMGLKHIREYGGISARNDVFLSHSPGYRITPLFYKVIKHDLS